LQKKISVNQREKKEDFTQMDANKISANQREKKRFHADKRRNNQRKSARE